MAKSNGKHPISALAPRDRKSKAINVLVETPKGSRNKFKFDEELGVFTLGSILPSGMSFPYDFGYIPGTKAEDGDPLDVLLLMDGAAFPGCRVESRLIGVIQAEQSEKGETVRNDRLVAVAIEAPDYKNLKSLKDIDQHLLKEIEHFFKSYNELKSKRFKLLGCRGPAEAKRLLQKAMKNK